MHQRQLAEKVNIGFTYLSKIESGAMPPPSEKVILQLAETFNIDKDELIILAGKIPSDTVHILKKQEMLQSLRAARARELAKPPAGKREGPARIKWFKGLPKKIAVPAALVLMIATLVWFAAPTKAFDVTFPTLPTSGTLGSSYTFTTKISITSSELLPIQSVTLYI